MTESQQQAVPCSPVVSRYAPGLADLAGRAVALQPTAEEVLQVCGGGGRPPPAALLAEGNRVVGQYRRLQEELRVLGRGGPLEAELAGLLDEHIELMSAALAAPGAGATGTGSPSAADAYADRLGQIAGRLVAVRNQLRRAEPFQNRAVNDVPTGNRL